jgi:hypothetical protein
MVQYTIDEVGQPVFDINIKDIISEESLNSHDHSPSKIGWYTDYNGIRGDIAIHMGLVQESSKIVFDLTEPTFDQLVKRYGSNNKFLI